MRKSYRLDEVNRQTPSARPWFITAQKHTNGTETNMKKLSRRDYLIGMGAGAVGIVGASALEAAGQRARRPARRDRNRLPEGRTASSAGSNTDWPWTPDEPTDNPGVRVIFAGMVAFTYEKDDALVVFHRGDYHHQLKIVAYEGSKGHCSEIYRNEDIPNETDMDLRVLKRSSDARFFKGQKFDRSAYKGKDKDFRWLLDLEAPPFNSVKLHRKDDKFSTELRVRQGTFYTYRHTGSTFLYNYGTGSAKLGYVPKVMAADIKLQSGDCLSFKINTEEIDVKQPLCQGKKYEIFFLNECDKSCQNSDFNMVFDAVENPRSFDLTLEIDHDNGPADDLCMKVPSIYRPRFTDEAPCMGLGFGGGGGFP